MTNRHLQVLKKAIQDGVFMPIYVSQIACLLLYLFLCLSSTVLAQDVEDLDVNYTELWSDMTLSKRLNEKWAVGGDFGLRSAINNNNWWQFYIRPNVNYKLSPIYNFTFGVGTFNTFSSTVYNTYEFRIYQDANINWPKLGLFNFSHRFRLEERFFSFSNDDVSGEFRLRGRYLIGVRTDPFSMGGEQKWTVYGSLEPFFPLGSKATEILANNFRWDTALSYQATDKLRVELHYILQTSEIFSRSELRVVENIFRIRVFQRL